MLADPTGKRWYRSMKPVDRAYVETRMRWEPLYEITEIKGDGETHPFLSPNDEFADYETWDKGNITLAATKTKDMLQYEYGRQALGLGMQLEQKLGTNPYKFGFIGSTDSHTGLATAQEDNFFGKHSGGEPNPKQVEHPMAQVGDLEWSGWQVASSGLAAAWARENTREALFDAMMNKEPYATTSSRMLVRFFGGWDFTAQGTQNRLPAAVGYDKGVPMGGDLTNRPDGKALSFLVAALREPLSGNLDRIQIVKVWHVVMTVNQVTPYAWALMDLKKDGPMVVVAPPKDALGGFCDFWQRALEDVGAPGPDRGKGGKYLVLPPGYDGAVPDGYFVVPSTSNLTWFYARANNAKFKGDAAFDVYGKAPHVMPRPDRWKEIRSRSTTGREELNSYEWERLASGLAESWKTRRRNIKIASGTARFRFYGSGGGPNG